MANAAKNLFTVDDWINMSDRERCELIEGDIVYKTMPSSDHSDAQNSIATIVNIRVFEHTKS